MHSSSHWHSLSVPLWRFCLTALQRLAGSFDPAFFLAIAEIVRRTNFCPAQGGADHRTGHPRRTPRPGRRLPRALHGSVPCPGSGEGIKISHGWTQMNTDKKQERSRYLQNERMAEKKAICVYLCPSVAGSVLPSAATLKWPGRRVDPRPWCRWCSDAGADTSTQCSPS